MKMLIVVDMVNGFVEHGALADKSIHRIVPALLERIKLAQKEGEMIVAFRDCHSENDEEFKSYPPHCLKGSSESELIDELKPFEKSMILIDKNTTNGFITPEFQELIKSSYFTDIEICGCCSDICVSDLTYSLAKYLSEHKIDTAIKVDERLIDTFNGQNHNADEVNKKCLDDFKQIGVSVLSKDEPREHLVCSLKTTKNRFLNLYIATYQTKKGLLNYEVVTRRNLPEVVMPHAQTDAVNILPYQYKDGKTYVYLIREFRYPLNDFVYGLPSGLIEEGEDGKVSAARELQEEIGARVIKIERTMTPAYTSCGMSDENIDFYQAEVELVGNQRLDGNEDISIVPVELSKLEILLNSRKMGAQSKLQLKVFLQQEKIKALEKEISDLKERE